MKVQRALRDGWILLFRYRRVWWILYSGNLILALLVVLPLQAWLYRVAGHSVMTAQSIGGFDFAFLTDLFRNNGPVGSLLLQMGLIVLVYGALVLFVTGGFLGLLAQYPERFRISVFVQNGLRYFWRLLKLAFCMLIVYALLLVLAYLVLQSQGLNPLEVNNDLHLMMRVKMVAAGLAILVFLVNVLHDYSKVFIVRENAGVMTMIGRGLQFIMTRFVHVILLYLINLIPLVILYGLYALCKQHFPGVSAAGIILVFIAGQCFLFGRIGVQLFILSSAFRMAGQGVPDQASRETGV